MFKHLTDLGYQRNKKEALGFYLAYLLWLMVAGVFIAWIVGMIAKIHGGSFPGNLPQEIIGSVTAAILCAGFALMILSEKRAMKPGLILLSLAAGMLSLLGGGLLGIVIPAYLSTIPPPPDADDAMQQ